MKSPIVIKIVAPNDARGWIGLGCFVLVLVVLGMIVFDKSLLENNAFLVLATAIVITGWANGPVGWAYQATKGGGEAAESTARIAEEAATAAIKAKVARPTGGQAAADGADEAADAAADRAAEIREEGQP